MSKSFISVETTDEDHNVWLHRYKYERRYDWNNRDRRRHYHKEKHSMQWIQVDPDDDQRDSQIESKSFFFINKGEHDRHGSAIKF